MYNALNPMPSVMKHNFSQVPQADIPRSAFNRSHGLKTTFDAGYLIPVYIDEALPGDTFNLTMSTFARLNTPLAPIMDNAHLDSFFFAVPIRLVWDNWQKFNGEQVDPGDSTDYETPIMTVPVSTGHAVGSLSDYFGIPTDVDGFDHVSLWHRAYNLIWNEWFRDQNLQDSVTVDRDDGPDDPADYVLLKRGKRHDYFTSCLPWPQKGEAVELPLGTSAPVERVEGLGVGGKLRKASDDSNAGAISGANFQVDASSRLYDGSNILYYDPNTTLQADLSTATAATINQLRQAFQVQKIYERDARGGTRYTEIVRSHFGVVSPDARLQRPEYLGGGTTPIQIHPVAQTSESSGTPQGTLTGFGTASQSGQGFNKSFTEHCLLIGMVCARADLNYQQGLNRMFTRRSRWDFYWPALSHIGEQAVTNIEIYTQGTSADDDVFGYQERYAEYRYKPSLVTGLFRSTASGSLDLWHLAQEFGSLPTLDDTFIQENPPFDRVVATPADPHFMLDCYFDLKTARPMPTYSVPGLIDHF